MSATQNRLRAPRLADDVVSGARNRERERERERERRLQYPCRFCNDFIRYPGAAGRHCKHRGIFLQSLTVLYNGTWPPLAVLGFCTYVYRCWVNGPVLVTSGELYCICCIAKRFARTWLIALLPWKDCLMSILCANARGLYTSIPGEVVAVDPIY